jgi:hypothetical protein
LLYYLGLLTIKDHDLGIPVLGIPNLVVEKLYFDYFRELLDAELEMPEPLAVQHLVLEMARHNRPEPLMALVAETLVKASARDFIHLNETGVKMILMSYLHASQLYYLRSEPEAEQGYIDLWLMRKPPIETPYQFIFELKFLKKQAASRLAASAEAGRAQLRRYLSDPAMQSEPNLRGWLVVFVGTELQLMEEVTS